MVDIFDVDGATLVPTKHCYALKDLKTIMDEYPEDYIEVYKYVFYMTCPDPTKNIFFDVAEHEKEEVILSQIDACFSPEDDAVIAALAFCKRMYSTPTSRIYVGIKTMIDKLADYMETTAIKDGRDGNITALVNAAAKFDALRQSFKGAFRDLQEEQKSHVRAQTSLGYDQQ